jgi:acetolactate synthase-1/2/3 large subunit
LSSFGEGVLRVIGAEIAIEALRREGVTHVFGLPGTGVMDLETAIRERLPVVAVINNNFALGNTRGRQAVAHGGRYLGVFYRNPDFAEFARLLGTHGERVERDADLRPALNRALDHARNSGLPAVVDVVQDNHEGLSPDL